MSIFLFRFECCKLCLFILHASHKHLQTVPAVCATGCSFCCFLFWLAGCYLFICLLTCLLWQVCCLWVSTAAKVLFPLWRQYLGCAQGLCRVLCSGVNGMFAGCQTCWAVSTLHQPDLWSVSLGIWEITDFGYAYVSSTVGGLVV